jgi:hypothetical protein
MLAHFGAIEKSQMRGGDSIGTRALLASEKSIGALRAARQANAKAARGD